MGKNTNLREIGAVSVVIENGEAGEEQESEKRGRRSWWRARQGRRSSSFRSMIVVEIEGRQRERGHKEVRSRGRFCSCRRESFAVEEVRSRERRGEISIDGFPFHVSSL